tara:strand:- start:575 stop:925 length:351 start_codon:yes stop_codon:yes gene_type:complete
MNFLLKVKKMIRNIFLLIIFISLYSCQSIKDGLTGKKYESSDEFLVIKKNPLVLPPDFNTLPEPQDPVKMSREETIELEIDEVLSSIKSEDADISEDITSSNSSSTEDFVIDQIKD